LIRAETHNIVEELKADIALALCECGLECVEIEGGMEDVAG
jgi:hypothetical protein